MIYVWSLKILNTVSPNQYACLCKISSCSGDRKLGFLKPKKLRAVNSDFAARRSVAARRCACMNTVHPYNKLRRPTRHRSYYFIEQRRSLALTRALVQLAYLEEEEK